MNIKQFLFNHIGSIVWMLIIGVCLFLNFYPKSNQNFNKENNKINDIVFKNSERENFVLVAFKNEISVETITGIYKDYDSMFWGNDEIQNALPIERIMDKLSVSHGIEKNKLADIILSRKYLESALCEDLANYENYEEPDPGEHDSY